jgi:lipopolysaccharide transport system ATP-binding protein
MKTGERTGTIEFNQVSKRYRLGMLGTLRGTLSTLLSRDNGSDDVCRTLWALRGVTFRVLPGESLGLIGPNGSGKTTTLKLLANITRPSSGRVSVCGRVSSLIELGAGFHPELTGRENIYLNGAILGLEQSEITRKLDAILDFSGLERFIDTPIKRYSSGMYVRLGFAVAAHVEPDILLVDEVLAVGDAEFRQKCINRMTELRHAGTVIVFVSHNMHLVKRLCDRVLLLYEGQLCFEGGPDDAIAAYEQLLQQQPSGPTAGRATADDAPLLVSSVTVRNGAGTLQQQFKYGEAITIRASYTAALPIVSPVVRLRLVADDNTVVAMIASHHLKSAATASWILDGQGELAVTIPSIEVISGMYSVEMRVMDTTDTHVLATGHSDLFSVQSPGYAYEIDRGRYLPKVTWHFPPTVERS